MKLKFNRIILFINFCNQTSKISPKLKTRILNTQGRGIQTNNYLSLLFSTKKFCFLYGRWWIDSGWWSVPYFLSDVCWKYISEKLYYKRVYRKVPTIKLFLKKISNNLTRHIFSRHHIQLCKVLSLFKPNKYSYTIFHLNIPW